MPIVNNPVKPNDPIPPVGDNTTVTIGEVTPDDQLAQFVSPSTPGIFTDYHIRSKYEKDYHRYAIGVTQATASTGAASVAAVQLANPTFLWIADWTAAKLGTVPDIPKAQINNDPNWVLLDEHYEKVEIEVAADGQNPLYRITGTYVYSKLNPDPTYAIHDMWFPRRPDVADAFERQLSDANLQAGLIFYL